MMLKSNHWKSLFLLLQLFSAARGGSNLRAEQNDIQEEENRILLSDGQTDLVRLIPFAVQVALDIDQATQPTFDHLNLVFLVDQVTDWMSDSFELKAQADGLLPNTTSFSSVGLVLENPGPQSTENAGVYTAQFTGVSLWGRQGFNPVDPQLVELIQRATNLETNKLMSSLQQLDDATGFGPNVLNVRAYITPEGNTPEPTVSDNSDSDKNLEIIIIIAIVVACLAFGLLLFAVIWAWRTDQTKHHHQQFKSDLRTPDGTGSESPGNSPKNYHSSNNQAPYTSSNPPVVDSPRGIPPGAGGIGMGEGGPPSEIDGDNYAASVISEDITTALTAYYKAGNGYGGGSGSLTGSGGRGSGGYHGQARELNDAASMSSMDSYGYSLDGYAPSLSGGPTQMGYPVGPLGPVNGQVKDPYGDDDESEDKDVLGVAPTSSSTPGAAAEEGGEP